MVTFKSDLSNKSFASQQLQEFDIPDESVAQEQYNPPARNRSQNYSPNMDAVREFKNKSDLTDAELEQQIIEARKAKISGRERLNDGAKRRIEMLIGMTQTTREVELFEGNVFVLQTLRSKEMRQAIMVAAEYDGTVQSPFEIRRQLLARSLVQVAGVDIAQFVGSNTLDARLALIDELDDSLLNKLFDEYQVMINEARDKFSLKSTADAQEVVEDLKK